MYGKLISGIIVEAEKNPIINNVQYLSPAPDWVYEALGYKKIIYTEPPECPEGYRLITGWAETDEEIRQTWTLVEHIPTPEEECEQLRKWFDNNYRQYNEKLTRFEAMGITETILDPVRCIVYSNLMELYEEAERVRDRIHQLENTTESSE